MAIRRDRNRHKLHETGALVALALAVALPALPSYAKKSGLTPAKVNEIKKTRASYETCRKDAVLQLKQGSISKKKFAVTLATCKESFPGADLYITCKKQAIRAGKAKKVGEEQAVNQCKRYLIATQFDQDEPVPFFAEAGQLFFAGIGLNRPLPASALSPPNFDCEKLQQIARSPAKAQYLLFGNHPRTFAGLQQLKGAELMQGLKMRKPKDDGFDVEGYGRVFGDPRSATGVVFFPSASCDFTSELGDMFSGLSAYYLLDAAGSSVTPYFGIAYYKGEQKKVTTAKLVQGLMHVLGPSYKTFSKKDNVTFIATEEPAETDDEQDPRNLCKQPRPHHFVAIVEGRKDDANKPEYAILANVKNLCDFGDRLSKRLVE